MARFVFYLMHDRKESTLKAYGAAVLGAVYLAAATSVFPPQNTSLTSL